MGGGDPTRMIRSFIQMGSTDLLEPMLKNVDMIKNGGDLLEAAIEHKKPALVDMFISKGADIMLPPDNI
jgi:hypothetical protein